MPKAYRRILLKIPQGLYVCLLGELPNLLEFHEEQWALIMQDNVVIVLRGYHYRSTSVLTG